MYDHVTLWLGASDPTFLTSGIVVEETKKIQFVTLSQKTTYLEGCQTLKIETPYNISPPCQV